MSSKDSYKNSQTNNSSPSINDDALQFNKDAIDLQKDPEIIISRRGSVEITLTTLVSNRLSRKLEENLSDPSYHKMMKKLKNHIFTSKKLPKLTVPEFINTIQKKTKCEDSTLVMGLMLLERYCEMQNILITPMNVFRLFYSSVVSSIKTVEDRTYTNKYYAKIINVTTEEFNELESAFLNGIEFRSHIEQENFWEYKERLKKESNLL